MACLFLLPGGCRAAMALLPAPTQDIYLVDDASMVEPEDREKILAMGRELDRKTKAQIVVVTMTSLKTESIEDYANKLFRQWGIGDKTKNNGVLLLIAKEDRKFRIEVGYGLEGAITDGYAGSVLDGMKAGFRKEEYSPAILAAYGKLVQKAYAAENLAAPEDVGAAAGTAAGASPGDGKEEEEGPWWADLLSMLIGVPLGIVLFLLLVWCLKKLLAYGLLLLTSGAVDLTNLGGGSSDGSSSYSNCFE